MGPWVGMAGALVALGVGAAVARSWMGPKQLPVRENPDGAPILVPQPLPDARPLRVTFGVPAEVVAAKIPPAPDENGVVPMTLYWKVHGDVPRSVGIFVHVIGPDGTRKSGDHELIAGTYFFKDAPRDVLLRDDFGANVSDGKPGTWDVYLGLWHAGGDGSRVPAFGPDGQRGQDDRVLIGRFIVPETDSTAAESDTR
ncbi:MAG: hypothetical protein IRZ16_21165 [Myxococcaceae bacterium]|nr:hypothetical protein [Myxococcaceae bacterium]